MNNVLENEKANLFDLYIDDKSFINDLNETEKKINKIKKYRKKVLLNPNKLYEVLSLDEQISMDLEKLYVYTKLKFDMNLVNATNNKNFNKVISLYQKYGIAASYLIPEILEKDYKFINKYLNMEPKLKKYEINLIDIFKSKKHMLSITEENMITSFSSSVKTMQEAILKVLNIDMPFGEYKDQKITNGNYEVLLMNENDTNKNEIYNQFFISLKSVNNTVGTLLCGIIHHNNLISKMKKYKTTLDMMLYKEDVDASIYENLLKNVKKNIKIFDKYWGFKKEYLKTKQIKYYDISTNMFSALNKDYSYEEAKNLILEVCLLFGSDYSNLVNKMFSESWIDVHPNKNKNEVAYTTCAYKTHPFIFLNYKGKFRDVSTLFHEIGHAAHYSYSKENNNFSNYENKIFVAEVASQVNEILLNKYLYYKSKNKEEKLSLLEDKLKDFEFIMRKSTMSADYEKIIHDYDDKYGNITVDILNKEYSKLLKKYYSDIFLSDELFTYEWVRLSMMFGKYYVYKYATGYMAALEIAQNIWDKKDGAIENYIKFLKLGSTKSPVDALKVAGVDMMSSKLYTKGFKNFENTLSELEKIYNSKEELNNE